MKKTPLKRKTPVRKRPKPGSIKALKNKADALYSQKLRREAADANGMVKCYTCTTVKHWKEMQCGHFVTRSVSILRYHHKNTKPQCPGCNVFNEGRKDVYAANLAREYGVEVLNELQAMKRQPPLKRLELEFLIEELRPSVELCA